MERHLITPQQFKEIKKIIIYKWDYENCGLGSGDGEYELLLQFARYATTSQKNKEILINILNTYSDKIK